MNPLAKDLNEKIDKESHVVKKLLSYKGEKLFFPKGILSQTAEAKKKAGKFDATIGMALENKDVMAFDYAKDYFNGMTKREIFPYAPVTGIPKLNQAWRKKQIKMNPSMENLDVSVPIPVAAITHGLFVTSDLFVDAGDEMIVPDFFWGNYKLIYQERSQGRLIQFPMFENGRFNVSAFRETVEHSGGHKLIVILNFPNNPTGYTPSRDEMYKIKEILVEKAEHVPVLVICDDAYFGLYYDDNAYKESPFGLFANAHENLLAVKIDGGTKEEYIWGWRVGFITYGIKDGTQALYDGLMEKTKASIRSSISSVSVIGQNLLARVIEDEKYDDVKKKKFALLRNRALKVKKILENSEFNECWTPLPFNSGYFMCLKLKGIDAETLRLHLLDKYETGVISIGKEFIRVAFSNVDEQDLEALFMTIFNGAKDIKGK